jgi:hypothetical protein
VEQIRQQGKAQEFQAKTQVEMQAMQAKSQTDMQAAQMKAALDQKATENQMAQEQRAAEMEYQLAQQKMQNEKEIALFEAQLAQDTALKVEQMRLDAQRVLANEADAKKTHGEQNVQMLEQQKEVIANLPEIVQGLQNTVRQMAEIHATPKRIVRGPDGRAVGVVADRNLQ